ncbi:hypothetical protein PoB_001108000 [Plakobranchus ocellatus]|uniref:Uncharacterized protein n=1 Tax=Plakobranchus ocellatus TaxID=259542 RepID=A0AAV3YNA5_9GAST|nr:hypothetical protein PoB_001108000 [Plakobranchus ocellatus]
MRQKGRSYREAFIEYRKRTQEMLWAPGPVRQMMLEVTCKRSDGKQVASEGGKERESATQSQRNTMPNKYHRKGQGGMERHD